MEIIIDCLYAFNEIFVGIFYTIGNGLAKWSWSLNINKGKHIWWYYQKHQVKSEKGLCRHINLNSGCFLPSCNYCACKLLIVIKHTIVICNFFFIWNTQIIC